MELRKNNTGEHTLDRVVRKSSQKRQNFKAGTQRKRNANWDKNGVTIPQRQSYMWKGPEAQKVWAPKS